MTNSKTTTDWLLSAAGLSFFGWLFFGPRGLAVGPAYLLLNFALMRISVVHDAREREAQFEQMLANTIGHARNKPCSCKKLLQFPDETCRWQGWKRSELIRPQDKTYQR